jgi:hypothetical protein
MAQRPMAAPVASGPSPVDTILAIAAAVVGVIAVASTVYLAFMIQS